MAQSFNRLGQQPKSINYNDIKFFEAQISIRKYSESNQVDLTSGFVGIMDNILIIRFGSKEGSVNQLLNLPDLEANFQSRQRRLHSSDFTFQLYSSLENTVTVIKLQSESIFGEFEAQIRYHCFIGSQTFKDSYYFLDRIGKGSQGIIDLYMKSDEPQIKLAVKSYNLWDPEDSNSLQRKMILNEIQILRELKGIDHIIRFEGAHQGETKLKLIMEYAKDGTMSQYMSTYSSLNEFEIQKVMKQLFLALHELQKRKIIHRDIKPDNVLIIDRHDLTVCLGDFGFACKEDDTSDINVQCGTIGYMDPGVLSEQPFNLKSDIFSLGCLLYYLITEKHLFCGDTVQEIRLKNQYCDLGSYIDHTVKSISLQCIDLLKKLTSRDEDKRPNIEQCLSHPWLYMDIENDKQQHQQPNKSDMISIKHESYSKEPSFSSFIFSPNYYQNLRSSISSRREECKQQQWDDKLAQEKIRSLLEEEDMKSVRKQNSPLQQPFLKAVSAQYSKEDKIDQMAQPKFKAVDEDNKNYFCQSQYDNRYPKLALKNTSEQFQEVLSSEEIIESSDEEVEDIESKVCCRVQICDLQTNEKLMTYKNQRYANYY